MRKLLLLLFTLPLHALALSCPDRGDMNAIQAWRQALIELAKKGEFETVRRHVKKCFTETEQPTCSQEVFDYASRMMADRSDNAHRQTPNILSSAADLPAELQGPSGDVIIPANIEAIAAQKGWKTVSYKTRSSGGFDHPPNLYLIAIPNLNGKKLDVYLQVSPLSLVQHGGDVKGMQVYLTVIAVDRSKEPPEGEAKLFKSSGMDGRYEWKSHAPLRDCIQCHTGPLRPISPYGHGELNTWTTGANPLGKKETAVDDTTKRKIDEINELMMVPGLRWSKVKAHISNPNGTSEILSYFSGAVDSEPPTGYAPKNSPTLTDEFLRQCSNSAERWSYRSPVTNQQVDFERPANMEKAVNLRRLRTAMNCFSCHDNRFKGMLHSKLDPREIYFKVAVDRQMPPNDGHEFDEDGRPDYLNQAERMALVSCLKAQREHSFVRETWRRDLPWLDRVTCKPMPSQPGPPVRQADSTR